MTRVITIWATLLALICSSLNLSASWHECGMVPKTSAKKCGCSSAHKQMQSRKKSCCTTRTVVGKLDPTVRVSTAVLYIPVITLSHPLYYDYTSLRSQLGETHERIDHPPPQAAVRAQQTYLFCSVFLI